MAAPLANIGIISIGDMGQYSLHIYILTIVY